MFNFFYITTILSLAILTKPEWVYIGTEQEELKLYYYDKMSIYNQGDNVRVWIKEVVKADKLAQYRQDFIARMKEKSIPTKGYETYTYTLKRYIFDCLDQKLKLIHWIDYNAKGGVIESYKSPDETMQDWEEVVPNSIGQLTLNKVCNK